MKPYHRVVMEMAGAILLVMCVVFGWETFANKPLLPWLLDRFDKDDREG